MKKIVLTVLIFSLAFFMIAGCGKGGDDSGDDDSLLLLSEAPDEPEPADNTGADTGTGAETGTETGAWSNGSLTGPVVEAWTLGCSAILATRYQEQYNYDPYVFGMFSNASDAQAVLSDPWKCTNHDEVVDRVTYMTDHGHNELFAKDYGALSNMSDEEYDNYLKENDDFMIPVIKLVGDKWGDKQIKAWDWFRMFHVTSWGYAAGYLELEEAYDMLLPLIERLKSTFSSWDEANDNYMDGFAVHYRANIIEPDGSDKMYNEYAARMKVLEELKAYPPEKTLFDPSVWK